MDIAALVAWIITALGGSYLLVTWLIRGGMRQQKTGATSFPAPLILGHFLFAASGLLIWIAYLLTEIRGLAWTALIGLMVVVVLGFTMFVRWGGETEQAGNAALASAPTATVDAAAQRDTARAGAQGMTSGAAGSKARGPARKEAEHPAESHFPNAVVAGHGAFAVSTLVLVVLAALGIGS